VSAIDLSAFRVETGAGCEMTFAVEGVACGGCVATIERELGKMPELTRARVNLTTKRLTIGWTDAGFDPSAVLTRLEGLGYRGRPFVQSGVSQADEREFSHLVRCTGVAAFGAMNIMLLSVSVWSGNATTIATETRDFLHWVSALIALPVAAYAGQPFYRNAWRGLRAGRLNMDAPISLGVIAAMALSLYETATSARHAYFDSAVMLLLFLLIGRTLDHWMRQRTRGLVDNLTSMRGATARVIADGQALREVPVSELCEGMLIQVRPGERIGADGVVVSGASEVDQSLISGESAPVSVGAGDRAYAGSLNLAGALTLRVERAAGHDLIEEAERLMNRALETRGRRVVLADRAVRAYAPLVHLTAGLSLAGWLLAGASAHQAIVIAVAVLIITCPCALGLAVPAVQVAASSGLMRRGVWLQAGDALERIAECDVAVFDKTGTLTRPDMSPVNADEVAPHLLALAGRLALASNHPVARALAAAAQEQRPPETAREAPGEGVEAVIDGALCKLGSPVFTGLVADSMIAAARASGATTLGFRVSHPDGSEETCVFLFRQTLRADARATIDALRALGMEIAIVSGDAETPVATAAQELGVTFWRSGQSPAGKIALLERIAHSGRKALMIGDGVNDAPALAAAHASISPSSASHIAQTCADALFLGDNLGPVAHIVTASRRARRTMSQNLSLSALYNIAAIPLAVAGYVTPLIAAAAMSGSSILVTLNALRARTWPDPDGAAASAPVTPAVAPWDRAPGGVAGRQPNANRDSNQNANQDLPT